MMSEYSDETRAAVMAALMTGQSVNSVSREYKIPKGTVSSWKNRRLKAASNSISDRYEQLADLIAENLTSGEYKPNRLPSKHVDVTSTCVYLIREEWKGYTKIGIAKDLKARIAGMQTGCPQPLSVYAYFEIDKPRVHEDYLHKRFAHKNIHGEWFDLSDDDLKLITNYFNAYVVADMAEFEALYAAKGNEQLRLRLCGKN